MSASPIDDVILCDIPSENTVLSDSNPHSTNIQQTVITESVDGAQQPVETNLHPKLNNDTADFPEQELDSDLFEILGEYPQDKSQYGQEIHKDLFSRLEYIATRGSIKMHDESC